MGHPKRFLKAARGRKLTQEQALIAAAALLAAAIALAAIMSTGLSALLSMLTEALQ